MKREIWNNRDAQMKRFFENDAERYIVMLNCQYTCISLYVSGCSNCAAQFIFADILIVYSNESSKFSKGSRKSYRLVLFHQLTVCKSYFYKSVLIN